MPHPFASNPLFADALRDMALLDEMWDNRHAPIPTEEPSDEEDPTSQPYSDSDSQPTGSFSHTLMQMLKPPPQRPTFDEFPRHVVSWGDVHKMNKSVLLLYMIKGLRWEELADQQVCVLDAGLVLACGVAMSDRSPSRSFAETEAHMAGLYVSRGLPLDNVRAKDWLQMLTDREAGMQ